MQRNSEQDNLAHYFGIEMMMTVLKILITLGLSGMLNDTHAAPSGIYGDDDRKDYFEIRDPKIKDISKSTVAIIQKSYLIELPNGNFAKKNPLSLLQQGMCSEAKFSSQVTYGHCSGSLIADDLVLTAGHCFTNWDSPSSFKHMYVVFDLKLESPLQNNIEIKRENVFEIKEVPYYEYTLKDGRIDLAIIRLNRTSNRNPLKVNRSFHYSAGSKIYMLGHPVGLPLKLTDNASISKIDTANHSFHNDLDAFSGNSGSSIFDANTNEIIGVLARGRSGNDQLSSQGCTLWGTSKASDSEEGMLLWDLPNI